VKYVYAFTGTSVYRYKIADDTWTLMYSAMPTSTSGLSVVWNRADNIYWLSGGTTPTFHAYYISSNTRTAVALATPPQRANSGATLAYDGGDNIYALLVSSAAGANQSWIYSYSISNNSWTLIGTTPEAIGTGGGLIRLGNYLYVASSRFAVQAGHFLRYDLVNAKWDNLADLPGSVVWENNGVGTSPYLHWDSGDGLENVGTNYIYANAGGSTQTGFFRFSISENKWTPLENTPGSQSGAGDRLASDGTYLYLVRAYTDTSFWRYRPPTRGVDVSISPSFQGGPKGATLNYIVTVTNTGSVLENFQLTKGDNTGWTPSLDNTWLLVPPNGENRTTTLRVTIPLDTTVGTYDNITVKATSKDNAAVFDNKSCLAYAGVVRGANVSILPGYKSGANGATLTYTVTVNNTGNVPDNYSLTVADNAGWSPSVLPTTLNLSGGSSGDATLSVTILENAIDGTIDNVKVKATCVENTQVSAENSCTAQMIIIRGVSVSISPTSQSGKNGATLTYTVTVTNTGNVSDNYTLDNTDTLGWTKSLSNTSVGPISPSAFDNTTTLSVTIPGDAIDGTIDNVTVTANGTGVSASAKCTAKFTILTEWVYVSSSPNSANYGKGVTGAGENIYIADSATSGGDSFMCYNTVTGEWTTYPNPTHIKNGTALVWDNRNYIYMILGGSYADTDRHYFYRFNISSHNWDPPLPNTPGVTQGAGDAITWVPGSALGVSGDNYIFAIVGGEGSGSNFLRYSVSSNTWTQIGTTWTRNTFPAETDDGCSLVWTGGTYLYALRGEDWDNPSEGGQAGPLYDFWCYDIVNNTWAVKENIPAYPHDNGGGGVGDGGSLLWIGGYLSDYIYAFSGNQWYPEPIYDNRFYLYTISANIWERLTDIPQGVGDHNGPRLGFARGKIYYWRGCEGGKDLWAYTPESGPTRGVQVVITPPSQENENGGTLKYNVLVKNLGNVLENFQLTKGDNAGWTLTLDNSWLLVPQGENRTTKLTVNIPTNATDGTWDNIWVKAASKDNSAVFDNKSCTAHVTEQPACGVEVTIENKLLEGSPSTYLNYTIAVHNSGNVVDNIILSYVPDGWPDITIVPPVLINVAPCEIRKATLTVHVPDGAQPCTYKPIEVIAESMFCHATDNDNAMAHVTEPPACGVEVTIENKLLEGWPSQTLAYTISVHNSGTVVDNIILSFIPDGWPDINIIPPVLIDVAPCEWRQATLFVHVPDGASPCTYKPIEVIAESMFCHATDSDNAMAHVIEKSENFTLHLVAGWNLIGFQVTNENMTPKNLFAGTTYTMYQWAAPYGPYSEPNKDLPVEDNRGYWVKENMDITITFSGVRPSSRTMYFVAGWNLVSFPLTSANTTPNNLFAGTAFTMYQWAAPYGPYSEPTKTLPVEDNRGYWVKENMNYSVTIPL
jgi:uncharacterized repeat protein (TIGR01451 family)